MSTVTELSRFPAGELCWGTGGGPGQDPQVARETGADQGSAVGGRGGLRLRPHLPGLPRGVHPGLAGAAAQRGGGGQEDGGLPHH